MKKFFALALVSMSILFAGCNMCGSPAVLYVYNPWGRDGVLEVSAYDVSATEPTDEALKSFGLPYYILGSGTYVVTLTKEDSNLIVSSAFRFTGSYYDRNRQVIKKKDGSGNGQFTAKYTARAVVSGIGGGNNFNAKESWRDDEITYTVGYDDKTDSYFLRAGSFRQTISYGASSATVTLVNRPVEGYTEESEIFAPTLRDKDNNEVESKEFTYKDGDLVYDNQTFAQAMRSYSISSDFASGSVTPTSFKTLDVISDKSNGVKELGFTVASDKQTLKTLENLYADPNDMPTDEELFSDPSALPEGVPLSVRQFDDQACYKVTLSLKGGDAGTDKVYYILKNEDSVQYRSDGTARPATSFNRVLKMTDGMNMVYTLRSFVNASEKEPKAE